MRRKNNLNNSVKIHNYKNKVCGDISTLQRYEKPILSGYERSYQVKRSENRMTANEQNAKRARIAVHDLVNTNWTEYTKMITLTYAKTMLDYDRLSHDYKMFIKHLGRKGINFPYLSITEHQTKRGLKEKNEGSLHLHVIVFSDKYIPFKTLKEAWGDRGSVHIEKIDKPQNKGAYVAKYITKDTMPPDKKSYRTSRDIKRPSVEKGLDYLNLIEQMLIEPTKVLSQNHYNMYDITNQDTGEFISGNTVIITTYKTTKKEGKR